MSAYDPRREAHRFAESIPAVPRPDGSPTPVIVVGLGLGYLALALADRLAQVIAFEGEVERLRKHLSHPDDAQLLNRVKEFATLRDAELEVLQAVQRGEIVVADPSLSVAPALKERVADLVVMLSDRPRLAIIHLKTAGDVIRTFAAVQAYKDANPATQITFLTEKPYGELARLAEGIDHVVELESGAEAAPGIPRPLVAVNFGNEAAPARLLRSLDPLFAVGFAATGDAVELVDERAPHRIAELASIRNRMNRYHFAYTLLGVPPAWNAPILRVPSNPIADRQPYGVVQFGAGSGATVWEPKRCSPEEMGQALKALNRVDVERWVAVGSLAEADVARAAGIPDADNLCGTTSWSDLAGILSGARLYIGHDSGPTHLAAALGTPTLALFGFTSPILNAPVGPRVLTIQADMPCAFGGCTVACPELACTRIMTSQAIIAGVEHLRADTLHVRLKTAAHLRYLGIRCFYPGLPVEDTDPLRTLLAEEPTLGTPRESALALAREWIGSTGR